jgi:hypothetical protein
MRHADKPLTTRTTISTAVPTERVQARSFGWLSALIATAVGLWCARGVLDVVSGSNDVTRVAMLPPWWLLATFIAVLGAAGVAAARAGHDPDVVLPLCALALLAVPYLPWLPDRLPVLRAGAGPARHLSWLVVCWLIGGGVGSRLQNVPRGVQEEPHQTLALGAKAPTRSEKTANDSRHLPSLIFLASAIVFGAAAWRLTGTPLFPGGDEPHYLVITQSLLHDGDLRIEDNHQREEYRAYFNRPLKPDYLTRGADGEIYSIHPVGLPVLAIPAFAVGGYRGVVAMLVLMAALAAALMWGWARDITGSVPAATFAWAASALTAPFLFNSFTVYPEIPGALAVMVAIAWRPESTSTRVMLIRGAAIGALPWLSTKYAPMAAAVAIVALVRVRWHVRAMAALFAPLAIALAAWFVFFFWIWGTASPSAPYGSSEPMTLRYLARGAPGLLFDQEYGVVAHAPVLALAFVGLVQMVRSGGAGGRRALDVIVILGALLVTVGAFHVWWGGTASPGRPIVSGVLLLGPPIAWLFASAAARPSARAGCHLLLASSLAIACALAMAQDGALLNNDRDGSAALLDWASPTWPLSSAFPSFIAGPLAAAIGRTLAWLALGAVVAGLIRLLRPRGFGAAALAALALGYAGAVTLASVATDATSRSAIIPEARARVPLLDRFDLTRRPTALLYDPLSRIAGADALARITLIARPGLRTAPQPLDLLWNARFALPAGEYQVQVMRRDAAPGTSTSLALQIGRTGLPLERWEITGSIWEHRFVLPIDAAFVGFRAPQDLGTRDGELRLTPVRVVDEGRRVARPPISSAVRYGAVTVFFHDESVSGEPNGYWTPGRASTQITYAMNASSPATIDVVVRCGAVANRVTLTTWGWQEQLVLEPGAARAVAIPAIVQPELGIHLAPLEISVRDGFVPAEIDRASTDRRLLGCWIEMGAQ